MILITRPKAEANKLLKELEAVGISSHVDSLSSISTNIKKISVKKNHAVLISSFRAAKIFSLSKTISKKVPLLIIGKVSERILIKAKFKNIIKTFRDSISLSNYLKKHKDTLFGVNHLAGIDHKTGTVSNSSTTNRIYALGIPLHKDEIYKTTFKKKLKQNTVKLIKSGNIKIAVVYSQQNARVLSNLMNDKKIQKNSKKIKYLCFSKQIGKIMESNGFKSFSPSKPYQKLLFKMIVKLSNKTF